MKNATIVVRVDKKLKKQAQELAKKHGVSLSLVVNQGLRKFIGL